MQQHLQCLGLAGEQEGRASGAEPEEQEEVQVVEQEEVQVVEQEEEQVVEQEVAQLKRRLHELEKKRTGVKGLPGPSGGAGDHGPAAAPAASQPEVAPLPGVRSSSSSSSSGGAAAAAAALARSSVAKREREAAEQRRKWERAERRLQHARQRGQSQRKEQPQPEPEPEASDPTPPPSPPPPDSPSSSSSDSEGGGNGGGGVPGPGGRPGSIERMAEKPVKFTYDEQPPVDVEMWLRHTAFYLNVMRAKADTDRKRRDVVLLLLDGTARNWWQRKSDEEQEGIGSFEQLRVAMLARFRPISARDKAMSTAIRIKQREGQSVQRFHDALTDSLQPLSRAECSEFTRTALFIEGLRTVFRAKVLEVPKVRNMTLSEVAELAIAREAVLEDGAAWNASRAPYPPDRAAAATGLRAMRVATTADDAYASEREPRRDASRERAPAAADGQLREDLKDICFKATLSAMQSRWTSSSSGWSGGARGRPGGAGGPAPPSSRTAAAESDRDERYRKGLCFVCGSAGHRARFCPSKQNAGEEGRSNRRSARYPTQQEN